MSSSWQAQPFLITIPRDGMAATQCLGNALDRIPPPKRLPDQPGHPSPQGKSCLRDHPPDDHEKHLRKGTSHHRAPEFVSRVAVMIAQLAPSRSRPVMSDRERRRIEDIPTGGHALQRVIRLLVHVEEHRLESPQGTIRRNPEARSGTGERSGGMSFSKVLLDQGLRVFIRALGKCRDGQLLILGKEIPERRQAIHVFGIAVIIQRENQFPLRLAHHPVTGGNGSPPFPIHDQDRCGKFAADNLLRIIRASIRRDQNLRRLGIQTTNHPQCPGKVSRPIPGRDHQGDGAHGLQSFP